MTHLAWSGMEKDSCHAERKIPAAAWWGAGRAAGMPPAQPPSHSPVYRQAIPFRPHSGGNRYTGAPGRLHMEVPAGDIDMAPACGEAMRLLEAGKTTHAEISARTGLTAVAVGIVADAVSWRGADARGGGSRFQSMRNPRS